MIEVIKAGLYSSLQDLGRFGYRSSGVPVSGAMDAKSAAWANALLGNREKVAVLEFTASGPILQFKEATYIAITGARFHPKINGKEVSLNSVLTIAAGDLLSFGVPSKGLRGYLAVAGGFIAETLLGSASFYAGITEEPYLKKGDILSYDSPKEVPSRRIAAHFSEPKYQPSITADKGPEFGGLSSSFQEKIMETQFKISPESNRMAYILGHKETFFSEEIITAPVQPGTVQLTPGGKMIILMRDAQTTGGYGRILQLTEDAINNLAQMRAGETVWFNLNRR